MNITSLRYFLSAAELSSFTKAAKKHYVAQTAVSQQIAKLEQQLGVKLFIRENNRVVLTGAGQVFYENMERIIQEYDLAIQKVNRFGQEEKKVITVGYTQQRELQLLTEVIREFGQNYPDVVFVIKEDQTVKLMEEVEHGLCDLFVNISCTFSHIDEEVYEQYTIYHGNMVVGLSKDHLKADQTYLTANELAEEKFIVLNINNSNYGFHEMKEHCNQDGYELHIVDYAPNLGAQMMMVELNRGVSFFQDLMLDQNSSNIRFLPIHNSAHQYDINVLWKQKNDHPHVLEFIKYVKKRLPQE